MSTSSPTAAALPYARHAYGTTQFDLPDDLCRRLEAIADEVHDRDLAEDGVETNPHITALYGLVHATAEDVAAAVAGFGPVTLRLGRLSLFKNDEHEVLKISVDSPDLIRLNERLARRLEHVQTQSHYSPHATICYVRPGRGRRYTHLRGVEGWTCTLGELTFSDADGQTTVVPLDAAEQYARDFDGLAIYAEDDPTVLAYALEDWEHRPGPRSKNRWVNRLTQKVWYGEKPPGTRQAARQETQVQSRVHKEAGQVHAREQKADVKAGHVQAAHLLIRHLLDQSKAGELTPNQGQAVKAQLVEHLTQMTVKEIGALKQQYGFKASGVKLELAAKVASRALGIAPPRQPSATPRPPRPPRPAAPATGPQPWEPGGKPEKDTDYWAPLEALHVDPVRFQFKLNTNAAGVTDEFKDTETFNPKFAGVVAVWQDPADGKTYVINGHHRHEIAARTGYPKLPIRYLDAKTATQARGEGALINIAEGRGTAVDAAKFMRDIGTSSEELARMGMSLKGKLASDAAALTNLNDRQFDRLARGLLNQDKALAVAKHLHNPELQDQLFSLLAKREDEGKDLQPKVIEEMAMKMAAAPTVTETEPSLFGDITSEKSLFVPISEVQAHVRGALAKEVNDFLAVANARRAGRVAGAGNTLNVEENRRIAQEGQRVQHVYEKLVNRKGPIADAINEAGAAYAAATTKGERDAAKQQAVAAVRDAVFAEAGVGQSGAGAAAPGIAAGPAAGAAPEQGGTEPVGTGRPPAGEAQPAGAGAAGGGAVAPDAGRAGERAAGVSEPVGAEPPATPQPGPKPRGLQDVLRDTRTAERQLGRLKPGDPKQAELQARIKQLNAERAGLRTRGRPKPQQPAAKPEGFGPEKSYADAGGKEPWQLSQKEWDAARAGTRFDDSGAGQRASASRAAGNLAESERLRMGIGSPDKQTTHRDVVEAALAAGKPVPPDVLADYPDLAAKQQQPGSSAAAGPGTTSLPAGGGAIPPSAASQPSLSPGAKVQVPASHTAGDWEGELTDQGGGKLGLQQPGSGLGPSVVFQDKEQAGRFLNDLAGKVPGKPDAPDPSINRVLSENAKFLGRGNDGLAFDTGDGNVVKVSSEVPYHWNNGLRPAEEGAGRLRSQVKANDTLLAAGVPGILPQKLIEHGGRAFVVMPKLNLEDPLTAEHLEQVKQSVQAAHKAGYTFGDDIQAGIGQDGKAYVFDTGAARPLSKMERDRTADVQDDESRLARLFEKSGVPFKGVNPSLDYDTAVREIQRASGSGKPVSPAAAAIRRKKLERLFGNLGPDEQELLADSHKEVMEMVGGQQPAATRSPPGASGSSPAAPEKPAATPSHAPALAALPVGDLQRVAGFPVRRVGPDDYRIETQTSQKGTNQSRAEKEAGYVKGDARKIAAYIETQTKQDAMHGRARTAAIDRVRDFAEPSFMDAEGQQRAQAGFAALPEGTPVVSLEEDTHGRTGKIVRDAQGKNRVQLDGEDGFASGYVEPLDARLSWRAPEQKEEGAKQGGLFGPSGEKPAEQPAPPSGEKPARLRVGSDTYTQAGDQWVSASGRKVSAAGMKRWVEQGRAKEEGAGPGKAEISGKAEQVGQSTLTKPPQDATNTPVTDKPSTGAKVVATAGLDKVAQKTPGGYSVRGYLRPDELSAEEVQSLKAAGVIAEKLKRGRLESYTVDTEKAKELAGLKEPERRPIPTGPVSRGEASGHIEDSLNAAGFTASAWSDPDGSRRRLYLSDKNGKFGYLDLTHEGQIVPHLDRQKGAVMSAVPDLQIRPEERTRRAADDRNPPDDPMDRMEWERQRELGRTGELPGA